MSILSKKKIIYLLPYLFFFILSLIVFVQPIANSDEIWNYNFARNIYDGRAPYEDFNMVQTPLSAYLSSAFLFVFGNHLLAFRIASAVLLSITTTVLYKLCILISRQKTLIFVFVSFTQLFCASIWIYNYNNLNLLLILTVMYFEVKCYYSAYNKKRWMRIFIGFLIGLIPLIKQSTGIVFLFLNFIICMVSVIRKPEERRLYILQLFVSIFPCMLFVINLIIQNRFSSFFDYTIIGIKYFTHRRYYFSYIASSPIAFFLGLFPVYVNVKMIKKMLTKKKATSRRCGIMLLLIAVCGSSVVYPLCDTVHMIDACILFIPCFFYSLNHITVTVKQRNLCVFVVLLVTMASIWLNIPISDGYKISELNHYQGLPISVALEDSIKQIDIYIINSNENGEKVVIADENGAACMIPIDQFNKDFDMLLVGNVGSKDIKTLLRQHDGVFLVKREDESLGYQAHQELIQYIKQNYIKCGEVLGFDAYKRIQ